jgi:hypothetical protein
MLPILIIWLIRRHRVRHHPAKNVQTLTKGHKKITDAATGFLLATTILFFVTGAAAQNKSLSYEILRNGSKVGMLHFTETTTGDMNYLKMESDVKTRFLFTFTVRALEETVYYNGIMVRSSIYRQLNGVEKVNKQHQADNKQYIIHAGKNSEVTKYYPITYNMLCLYSIEPERISKVYSDNFETFVDIEKAGPHRYKITLPDGNYNYYNYKNGVLTLMEIHHSLYAASIILTN